MKKLLKFIGLLLVLLTLIGIFYEQYKRYIARNLPLDGKFINIDNKKIHIVKKGSGGIPVIFESGWETGGHLTWSKVQNSISKSTQTISYDRFGILRSDSPNTPRTCDNITNELNQILEHEKIEKPYILVAHSLGGVFTKCYVDKYKDEIAGVILIDSAHHNQLSKYSKKTQEYMLNLPPLWLMNIVSFSGIGRVYSSFLNTDYPSTQENDRINIKNKAFIPVSFLEYIREGKNFSNFSESSKNISLGVIPLIVLSATKMTQGIKLKDWEELQSDIVNLSTKSEHIWVENSGHYIQLEQPNVVIDAIKEMILISENSFISH